MISSSDFKPKHSKRFNFILLILIGHLVIGILSAGLTLADDFDGSKNTSKEIMNEFNSSDNLNVNETNHAQRRPAGTAQVKNQAELDIDVDSDVHSSGSGSENQSDVDVTINGEKINIPKDPDNFSYEQEDFDESTGISSETDVRIRTDSSGTNSSSDIRIEVDGQSQSGSSGGDVRHGERR